MRSLDEFSHIIFTHRIEKIEKKYNTQKRNANLQGAIGNLEGKIALRRLRSAASATTLSPGEAASYADIEEAAF